MKFISNSLAETKKCATEFLDDISKTSRGTATVIGLYGNLGSGKTTFVQCVAEILGVRERVTSPTFVILKRYTLHANRYTRLFHVDAYRLKSGEELAKLGWQELSAGQNSLIFIEWPEHVKEILPADHMEVHFEFINETTRAIEF